MEWKTHLKYFIFLLHFGGVAAVVYDRGLAPSWLYLLEDHQVSGKTGYTTYEGAGTKTDSDNQSLIFVCMIDVSFLYFWRSSACESCLRC